MQSRGPGRLGGGQTCCEVGREPTSRPAVCPRPDSAQSLVLRGRMVERWVLAFRRGRTRCPTASLFRRKVEKLRGLGTVGADGITTSLPAGYHRFCRCPLHTRAQASYRTQLLLVWFQSLLYQKPKACYSYGNVLIASPFQQLESKAAFLLSWHPPTRVKPATFPKYLCLNWLGPAMAAAGK